MVGEKISVSLGQSVVVENKPGASNNLGTDFVAKSPPDGYTLVIVASSHATNKHMFKSLPYDPVKDFEPVVYTHVVPLLLAVHPSVPAKTVPELITWIKANPDKANYASSGPGSSLHMAAELFMNMTGTKMQHVPYKGSSAAHPDLMAGRTMMIFDTVSAIQQHVKSGAVRGIAVTTTERSPRRSRSADDLGSRAERLRRRDLGRDSRAGRHAEGHRREAQRRDQRGAEDGRREGKLTRSASQIQGGTPEHFGNVIKARGRQVGQAREGGRHPARVTRSKPHQKNRTPERGLSGVRLGLCRFMLRRWWL